MTVKELRRILRRLPDDADIVIEKQITEKKMAVFPVISHRLTKTKDKKHSKVVLQNLSSIKKEHRNRFIE